MLEVSDTKTQNKWIRKATGECPRRTSRVVVANREASQVIVFRPCLPTWYAAGNRVWRNSRTWRKDSIKVHPPNCNIIIDINYYYKLHHTFLSTTAYRHRSTRTVTICFRSSMRTRTWGAYKAMDRHLRVRTDHVPVDIGTSLCNNTLEENHHLHSKQERSVDQIVHFRGQSA